MMLQKISFRQLLVLAFLLIAALLGSAAVRALYTLEQLTLQSRQSATRALELSSAAQSLTERSVSMERASRQAVVLADQSLRNRFDAAAKDAGGVMQQLSGHGVAIDLIAQWKQHVEAITGLLSGVPETALDREQRVAREFREIDVIGAGISKQVQLAIETQNRALLDQLEGSRQTLTQQVTSAIALSVVLALAFGIWLTQPLQRLEAAIIGLGENRLDKRISINGPADLQLVGQRLDWLRLRLVELDADKARFLRHISHELKTPLASLREGVSLLEDGVAGELSEDQQEVARILRQNTSVLQRQIEDLLRFNAAAFEARQLHRTQTNLLQLIESQVEAQRLQWRARNLRISVEGKAAPVQVDAEKIGTALANLISNAIRYSPTGGSIRITLAQQAGGILIDITDEGPGVANADRDHIFEPFYRGQRQPVDTLRGSGIGLSIVQEYISAHGGRTELLPDLTGAHFRIELPHASNH